MPKELSNEYLAGFFDGEGCIIIAKRKARSGRKVCYVLQCCIAQVTLEPLDYLYNKYGGVITNRKKPKNCSECYFWIITGNKAKKFTEDIYPYIYLKKDEFDIAFQFCSTLKYTGKELPDEVLNYREVLKQELSRCKNAKRVRRTVKENS